jgi:hypothetical protein
MIVSCNVTSTSETWPSRLGKSQMRVKYGYGFWATRTIEWLHSKLQTRPLVREGALLEEERKYCHSKKVKSGRQRGRPTEIRLQISDSNIPTGSNILSQVPQGWSIPRHTDWLTDWLTVSRKVTSTFGSSDSILGITSCFLLVWTCMSVTVFTTCHHWTLSRNENLIHIPALFLEGLLQFYPNIYILLSPSGYLALGFPIEILYELSTIKNYVPNFAMKRKLCISCSP